MAHAPDQDNVREDASDGQTQDTIDTTASDDAAPADDATSNLADAAASNEPVAPATAQAPKTPSQASSAAAPEQPSPQPGNLAELSTQLREAAAEIAEIAAQAGRLGIAIDAAKALREGTSPGALRKLVLQRASDARDVVAAAPSPILPKASESPIVAAAKRAAASPRG